MKYVSSNSSHRGQPIHDAQGAEGADLDAGAEPHAAKGAGVGGPAGQDGRRTAVLDAKLIP